MIPPKLTYKHATLFFACWAFSNIVVVAACPQVPGNACPPIARTLPPEGLQLPSAKTVHWLTQLDSLANELNSHNSASAASLKPDIEVLLKACRMAIEYRELYSESDFAKVDRLLEMARQRVGMLAQPNVDWTGGTGRQIRGFQSIVDESVQPIGLLLPDNWQTARQALPLYVWLHGRGDKTTDLHFICDRLDNDGEIHPAGAIVLHPFGRQCIGYKSAGETDVLEAIEFVCRNYPVDRQRIVLMGFSMGGAGVWHLAAHYADRFVAASPGAGFAETARYQNLRPEQYPAAYVQTLWSIYDVPGYTRNLFNLPIVAYSGELDKQIQAARVMEEAFAKEGRTLDHTIGPGMGHKYDAGSLQSILDKLASAVQTGQPTSPKTLYIQSKHPRYARHRWLVIDGMAQTYEDTRAMAQLAEVNSTWKIESKNATRLRILPTDLLEHPVTTVLIDDTSLQLDSSVESLLRKLPDESDWKLVDSFQTLRKRPGLSGPIDDAFIEPFLVVLPSEKSANSAVEQWIQCELAYFKQRWEMVFRGKLRTKRDTEVTLRDMQDYHLIVWGEPTTNRVLEHLFDKSPATNEAPTRRNNVVATDLDQTVGDFLGELRQEFEVPMDWNEESLVVGEDRLDVEGHVLLAVYPNPWVPSKYIVINSGPTFRSAHDRTNSLQNPQLPDWAIIALDELPSADRPGRISAAGFFDGGWQPH